MKKLLLAILITSLTIPIKAPKIGDSTFDYYYKVMEKKVKEEFFLQSEFSPLVFYEALVFMEIQNPEIVFKQSILETGWFRSQSFLKYHNPFGMKQPVHRETHVIGSKLGHGEFSHWYQAVKDYKLWQDYWIEHNLNPNEYYLFLDQLPYAEAKNYTRILRTIDIYSVLINSES